MTTYYIALALELAARARGRTSPNPMVGAVLVKDGQVVGAGYHAQAGGPHAEAAALKQAGARAQGATLYVTLEPCNHYGRTPPCTEALIAADVAEVHMAMLDPNPKVAGRGRAALDAAGIPTWIGAHEAEAQALNEVYCHWISMGKPFVWAKFAMSLDGKIATRTGDARWISGPEARQESHRLRDQLDAILVGANTVITDNPRLTTRLEQASRSHPLRVILDSRGRVPLTAQVFSARLPGTSLVATTAAMPADHRQALEARGVNVWVLPAQGGCVCLESLLTRLGQEAITGVLVEGGGAVLGSFFDRGLVNKVTAFVSPCILGGQHAPGPVAGLGVERMAQAWRLEQIQLERRGADVQISGYPARNR